MFLPVVTNSQLGMAPALRLLLFNPNLELIYHLLRWAAFVMIGSIPFWFRYCGYELGWQRTLNLSTLVE
jgi:hypothetical protein